MSRPLGASITAFEAFLAECVWIGFKATDGERTLILEYAKRLREARQEDAPWVDPLERKA